MVAWNDVALVAFGLCEEQPLPNGSISARARDNTMNRQMCDLVPVSVALADLVHYVFKCCSWIVMY
jgi:hypothetical protein